MIVRKIISGVWRVWWRFSYKSKRARKADVVVG